TESSPEAYERLLLDVLLGDAALFPQNEEVEQSWRVIDPIEELWRSQEDKGLHLYRAGEWGPAAAEAMLAADGRTWRRP
ncbi:MAG: glucose-6-phosphate 1-dehydrogenase, partial [Frankiales bacterium]|nr:glucose-6-phosphate 1-dehydrogenase [Frankiales bacterium]